jgi:hypothetical protein
MRADGVPKPLIESKIQFQQNSSTTGPRNLLLSRWRRNSAFDPRRRTSGSAATSLIRASAPMRRSPSDNASMSAISGKPLMSSRHSGSATRSLHQADEVGTARDERQLGILEVGRDRLRRIIGPRKRERMHGLSASPPLRRRPRRYSDSRRSGRDCRSSVHESLGPTGPPT